MRVKEKVARVVRNCERVKKVSLQQEIKVNLQLGGETKKTSIILSQTQETYFVLVVFEKRLQTTANGIRWLYFECDAICSKQQHPDDTQPQRQVACPPLRWLGKPGEARFVQIHVLRGEQRKFITQAKVRFQLHMQREQESWDWFLAGVSDKIQIPKQRLLSHGASKGVNLPI